MRKSKIYFVLEESEFKHETENYIFYFSSLFYLEKFLSEIEDFHKKVTFKFFSLYNMPVYLKDYSYLVYYNKVEKRGFHVYDKINNEVIKWLGDIILSGQIKTKESFND